MGFNVYLLAGAMIRNIKFYKVQSIERVLHDIQRCVLLHVTANVTNLFCKKLREANTSQRHIQNLARHMVQPDNCLRKYLAALSRFLYSQKAPCQIFDTIPNTSLYLLRFVNVLSYRERRSKNCASIFNDVTERCTDNFISPIFSPYI